MNIWPNGPNGPRAQWARAHDYECGAEYEEECGAECFECHFFPEFSRAYISLGATTDYSTRPKNYSSAKVLIFEDSNTMNSRFWNSQNLNLNLNLDLDLDVMWI